MMKYRRRIKNEYGYTMAELLITVAILTILLGLISVSVINIRKHLRQKALDAKAEVMYTAVQNRLSKMKAGGNSAIFQYQEGNDNGVGMLDEVPSDAAEEDGIKAGDICYFTSAKREQNGKAAHEVMNKDTVDTMILDQHWVVEFNPKSAVVYAVFYSEKLADCASEYTSSYDKYDFNLRYKKQRLRDGAKVGYYGGGSAGSNVVTALVPQLNITNAERLVADLSCALPNNVSEYPVFKLELKDTMGNTFTKYYTYGQFTVAENTDNYEVDYRTLTREGRMFKMSLVLDDLSNTATRFVNLYGSGSHHNSDSFGNNRNEELVAGTALTVTLTVSCPGNFLITQNQSKSFTTNSLFSDDSSADPMGYITAGIHYGRHLQNLDQNSGVTANVRYAQQGSDILFSENVNLNGLSNWKETYSDQYYNGMVEEDPNFQPISNPNLLTYYGAKEAESYRICGLTEKTDGHAGLFASLGQSLEGVTENTILLSDILLTGTYLNSKNGNAGALAGNVEGNVEILHCQSLLTEEEIKEKKNTDVFLYGKNVGGLIGYIDDGTVVIHRSAASTVLGTKEDTLLVGGIVGGIKSGSLSFMNTYADCYMAGEIGGGLVGKSESETPCRITSCYSAGFLTALKEGAGFVAGEAALNDSYTILSRLDMMEASYHSTAAKGSTNENVYYIADKTNEGVDLPATFAIGNMTMKDLCDKLNKNTEFFTMDTSGSMAYNLMNQGLSAYTYPGLKDVPHYGDWSAEFQVGALVYYEAYLDGSYGFYGANVESTLKNDQDVVGDGYGVVYQIHDENIPEKIRVQIMDQSEEIVSEDLEITPQKGYVVDEKYRIYPLSKEIVNQEHVSEYYYLKAIVTPQSSNVQTDYYYFNPHFAKTVIYLLDPNSAIPALHQGSRIAVRTARHLYNMSLFYDEDYARSTEKCEYLQERNIDYEMYEWNIFSMETSVSKQEPIGMRTAFKAIYNGQCYWIKNISFVTEHGNYVGFFGSNSGSIRNVVLRANYHLDGVDNFYIKRSGDVRGENVFMGILAGYNGGSVRNCAVAGYYVAGSDGTIHAYENSQLYIGGLVGINTGSIQNSTADCPNIRVSSTFANVFMGGFAGYNNGLIHNSYDLGHLEVAYSRGGRVSVSGFAARNDGLIQSCYCATAITASGETTTTYGFAPNGGSVDNQCYFLNNGTYSYVKKLYSFNFDTGSGIEADYSRFESLAEGSQAKKSYDFSNTYTDDRKYPFRAVVKNRENERVHYGDWLEDEKLGTVGIFYWEKEEQGSNNGYHFTYLGNQDQYSIGGSSLCTSHDDGGKITEFGYGFFEQKEGSITKVTMSDMVWSGKDRYNQRVSREFERQMRGYHFYAYTTTMDKSGDYICLDGSNANSNWEIQCSFGGMSKTYHYVVSPFFANAMQYADGDSSMVITGSDGVVSDYRKTPGLSESNPYEVRSLEQLQYINWNYSNKNVSTEVDASTYKNFTYLQYATVTGQGTQTKEAAEKNRPYRYWRQSHDMEESKGQDTNYTPIAAAGTTSVTGYEAVLYAWFGNEYRGESYTIKNVNIHSKCYSVGLFGVTAGARIQDMILYSDKGSVIERVTDDVKDHIGAYAVGGLIGVAFDYCKSGTILKTNSISNCVIAGYTVADNSRSQQGLGETNVGGLIGVANVDLQQCSAVTNIEINCTHNKTVAKWGNFIRVGGLTGAAQGQVTNCYSGGNISVSEETLKETYAAGPSSSQPVGDCVDGINALANSASSTHVYIAGIAGSAFTSNYKNFTNSTSIKDGAPTFTNCYTYVNFPVWTGTICTISLIASNADRYTYGKTIPLNNCYYLGQIADITYECPKFYYTNKNWNNLSEATRKTYIESILAGSSKYLHYFMKGTVGTDRCSGKLTPLTYEQMSDKKDDDAIAIKDSGNRTWQTFSDALNQRDTSADLSDGKFHWVTVTEGSEKLPIDGKYSFSGENKALEGKNYPFPTIIKQPDLTFGGYVQVHYGEWPVNGLYWTQGRAIMDIFDKMDQDGHASMVYFLKDGKKETAGSLTKEDFTLGTTGIAKVMDCVWDEAGKQYIVNIQALNTGTTTVMANGTTADFTLEITADIHIRATTEPDPFILSEMESGVINLEAVTNLLEKEDTKHYEIDPHTTWTVTADHDRLVDLKQKNKTTSKDIWNITRNGNGTVMLNVMFHYDYNGIPIENQTFVNVLQPDSIGVSDGHIYQVADLKEDGEIYGKNTTYSVDVPEVDDMAMGDFFFYMNSQEKSLVNSNLREIDVKYGNVTESFPLESGKEEENSLVFEKEEGKFHVELSNRIISDDFYQYICGKIYYKTNEALESVQNVELSFLYEDGATYHLSLIMDQIPVRRWINVTYSDGLEQSVTQKILSGEYTIKDYKEFAETEENFQIPEGKEFSGWYDAATDTYYEAGQSIILNQNLSLTPNWKLIPYKVTLDVDSGVFSEESPWKEEQFLTIEDVFTFPQAIRKGYDLEGWEDEEGAIHGVGEELEGIHQDRTFFARWTPENHEIHYEFAAEGVEFAEGFEGMDHVFTEETLHLPDVSAVNRSGYILAGWTYDGDLLSPGAFVTNVLEDRTYVARWAKLYKIHFNGNLSQDMKDPLQPLVDDLPGDIILEEGKQINTVISKVKTPQYKDYVFAGWALASKEDHCYKNSDELTKETAEDLMEAGATCQEDTITLYAKWYPGKTVWMPVDAEHINSEKDLLLTTVETTATGRIINLLSYTDTYGIINKKVEETYSEEGYHLCNEEGATDTIFTGNYIGELVKENNLFSLWKKEASSYQFYAGEQIKHNLYVSGNLLSGMKLSMQTANTTSFTSISSRLCFEDNRRLYYLGCDGNRWTVNTTNTSKITFYQEKNLCDVIVEYPLSTEGKAFLENQAGGTECNP